MERGTRSAALAALLLGLGHAQAAGLKVRIIKPVTGLDGVQISDINNRGEVTFNSYSNTSNHNVGAVWREGEIIAVPFAGRNSVGNINASGLVSGTGTVGTRSIGFRWQPGGNFELLNPLPDPSGLNATGSAGVLSDGGVAGGSSLNFEFNRSHAVLYAAGSSAPIDQTPTLNNHSFLVGVNDAGDVLISFNNTSFGVFNAGTALTTFGVPGSIGFAMNSLNESRRISGFATFATPSSFTRAVRWDVQGTEVRPTPLPLLPGKVSAIANAVNRGGDVVGRAFSSAQITASAAVAWIDGSPIDLNTVIEPVPGLVLFEARAISDTREVAGSALLSGNQVGFVVHLGDADGDGLLDTWETAGGGIDGDNDGTPDLNLHALGARPDHKDLFVEIDRGPIQDFPTAVVRRVVDAFADAPVDNPDGTTGIRLHLMRDETTLSIPVQSFPDGSWPDTFDTLKAQHFGTPAERANPAVIAAKRRAFRYCIVFNRNNGISGIAEIAGNDMAVFFGNNRYHDGFRDLDDKAILFMHEFGHALGLRHGGADNINCKPNYPSVMNYSLADVMQFNAGFIRIDYSRGRFDTLDEANLDEATGVRSSIPAVAALYRGFFMPYGFGSGPRRQDLVRLDGSPLDWNDNGVFPDQGAVQDLNYMGATSDGWLISSTTTPSPGQILEGHDDWSNIIYAVGLFGDNADLSPIRREVPHELGPDDFAEFESIVPPPPIPAFFARSDFNDDDLVDDIDFQLFAVNYDELIVPPANGVCDINGDDLVDDADFTIFVVAYDMLVPGG